MLEGEIVRKCLARSDKQCSFVEHRNHKARATRQGTREACLARCADVARAAQVVYRRYASLFVLAGCDGDVNALAALELVHCFVEALDRYFGAVCELDIMFHLDKAHAILDEMLMAGAVAETNRAKLLTPVQMADKEREAAGRA